MEFTVIERFLGCALYESVHIEDRRTSGAEQGIIRETKTDSAAQNSGLAGADRRSVRVVKPTRRLSTVEP
jgi:hypothetical protein